MVEIRSDNAKVMLEAHGPVKTQMEDVITGLHAWYNAVTRDQEDEFREMVKEFILAVLNDETFWTIPPDKMDGVIEVDRPEDLFETGGD